MTDKKPSPDDEKNKGIFGFVNKHPKLTKYFTGAAVGIGMIWAGVQVNDMMDAQNNAHTSKIEMKLFKEHMKNNVIADVRALPDGTVVGETSGSQKFISKTAPGEPFGLLPDKIPEWKGDYNGVAQESSPVTDLLVAFGPMLLLVGVWVFFMRRMQGGGAGAMNFGKSKAVMVKPEDIKETLADVHGIDEAKEDIGELVEFLENPEEFTKVGQHDVPKGILMVGPPGTGKTMTARAIAKEAKVPFFSISGSDFVEMFVGVGAARVRDIFEQAKKHQPCIIFIDEIDAVGRQRGVGNGGGNDEREQTLNQLLVEMDGFEKSGVIVIAATNRADVLDPALLRPGRFDRQVTLGLPDVTGRKKILMEYINKLIPEKFRDKNIDAGALAKGTPGWSGAQLKNLVNEAFTMERRRNKKLTQIFGQDGKDRTVNMGDFEKAKDKILMGAERKSLIMTEKQRRMTAYHEAGHTIIGVKKEPETDPVYKVSIMPRGKGLGVTISIPEGDQISMSQNEAEAVMAMMMGGRQAEAITFGDKTTGASNDIERATALARAAVYQYGWSALGPINLMPSQEYGYSADLLDKAEVEVKKFLDKSVEEATKVILDNTDAYKRIAEGLIEFETIDRNEVDLLIGGDDAFEKIRRARAALEEETPSVSTPPQSEIRAASPTIN